MPTSQTLTLQPLASRSTSTLRGVRLEHDDAYGIRFIDALKDAVYTETGFLTRLLDGTSYATEITFSHQDGQIAMHPGDVVVIGTNADPGADDLHVLPGRVANLWFETVNDDLSNLNRHQR